MALIFVFTDPGNGFPATNMILGTDAASEVLILPTESTGTLTPSTPLLADGTPDVGIMTPFVFLNILKEMQPTEEYLFLKPIKNWISKEDLPALLALTDSNEPCASVALSISSYWNTRGSTVGQEALFMIEGYRKGEYPPALNSEGYNEAGKKALVEWCRNELAAKK